MPYVLGLYAIAIEIDPTLTQDALRKMIVDTAYIDDAGMKIVNPVGFVARALQGVGRNAEAKAMLDEVKARTKYLYAVIDTATMTQSEVSVACDYLATITDATVLIVDAVGAADEQSLATAFKEDIQQRGGSIASVYIFGNSDSASLLQSKYKVQLTTRLDGGAVLYGVMDGYSEVKPNISASTFANSKGYIGQAPESKDNNGQSNNASIPVEKIELSNGSPVGSAKTVHFKTEDLLTNGTITIHGITVQLLDNGYTRCTVDYTAPKGMRILVFNPPNGNDFRLQDTTGTTGDRDTIVFDVSREKLLSIQEITIRFSDASDMSNRFFAFFFTSEAIF